MKSMRDMSRDIWEGQPSVENVNCGSLQRIADATEKMASSYDKMRQSRDGYKDWYERRGAQITRLEREKAALKGVITKLRKRAASLESNDSGEDVRREKS